MSSRPPRPSRPPPQTPDVDTPDSDPSSTTSDSPAALTPLRAHYLKKSLVQLQLRRELDDLTSAPADNASTLAYLGPPFSPPQSRSSRLDLPFLKYIFRHFIISFPFLAAAPSSFYSDKLQPFVANAFSRNISPSIPIDESDVSDTPEATRLKTLAKVERNLSMLIVSAIKLSEPEDVLRLSQSDLQSLERAVNKRLAKRKANSDDFAVNIVSVRTVTDRNRVRSRAHDEFIIRTTLSQDRQVCVARRHGDFKTLAEELRKAYPDSIVPSPPAKDRTAIDIPNSQPISSPAFPSGYSSSDSFVQYLSLPGSYYSPTNPPPSSSPSPPRLSREKNRLTLRAYLHTLLSIPPFSSSPVLRSFLFSGPTRLSPEEQEDARRREEADRVREEGKKKFAKEIGARVDQLRDAVRAVKGEIVGKDGLTHVFSIIKVTPYVRQLPKNYQAVLEWARISLASTIFQTYVAADNSSETFAGLKRIHGLMPYLLLKGALRISNPVAMLRAIMDIFLAQPFGSRSLLQRMFSSSLTEEVKSLNTYIELVSAKIDSPLMCEKIRLFVYAPREIQEMYRSDARAENTHLLRLVLMGGEEPVLSRSLAERVERSWRKWEQWMAEKERRGKGKGGKGKSRSESDSDDEGPDDDDAWLFEDLKVLVRLYSRLRDREQLIALIFEGITAELLKDIITMFYAPLAEVYRAASIGDSLGDMQTFINDLIRTVEQTEDLSQSDPSSTVQAFIDLVNRHEQSFYSFVHKVHSKDQGLFDSIMHWIERFLTVVREGVGSSTTGEGSKISLETLLPAGGEERAKIMEEVDEVMRWHYLNKIAHEEKVRRRFGSAQKGAGEDADTEDEAAQALLDSIASGFDFGELVRANADELAAEGSNDEDDEDDSEDDSDEDSSEYETDSDETEGETPAHEDMPEKPPTSPSSSSAASARLQTRPTPLPRSQTIHVAPQPGPHTAPILSRSQTSPSPRTPVGRQRSLSLHSAKSMGASGSPRPLGDDVSPVPPVPRLPTQQNKPLPPDPTESSSAGHRKTYSLSLTVEQGTTGDDPHPPPAPRPPQKPKKKVAVATQPPELKHIPTLLPIFVEMMRPLLRPQPNRSHA